MQENLSGRRYYAQEYGGQRFRGTQKSTIMDATFVKG
jgi:hypothetical protein